MNYFNEKAFHTTDPKGRLLLPKDVRAHFRIKKADVLYLLPNPSDPPCLEIRTSAAWEAYLESLRGQQSDPRKKDSYRYAMTFKEKATVDGQGRVLIPQGLRELCKIDGSVAVINMDVYVEVWAKEHMSRKYQDMIRAFKEMNDQLF